MATQAHRTDRYSPSNIDPAAFEHIMEFGCVSDAEGDVIEWGLTEASDIYLRDGAFIHGRGGDAIFRCDICGARYRFGSLFEHKSGEVISVGHTCANTLGMAYDVLAARRIHERLTETRLQTARRLARQRSLRRWARDNRDLLPLLRCGHRITRDIRRRLIETGAERGLSSRQVELLRKLHRDEQERANRPPEVLVPAPIADGRQVIEGEIVSLKVREGEFGYTWKVTVRCGDPETGCWLAWGTMPAELVGQLKREQEGMRLIEEGDRGLRRALPKIPALARGRRVRFTAKLRRGSDEHFALFSRPTKATMDPAG